MNEENILNQPEINITEPINTQIKEDLFVSNNPKNTDSNPSIPSDNSNNFKDNATLSNPQTFIEKIFFYLRQDFNSSGYSDALTMPDSTYLDDQIEQIIGNYHLLLAEAKFNFEKQLNDIEFYIQSRERMGLMDVADELKTKKGNVQKDLDFILIQTERLEKREGEIKNVMNSYKAGFRKGLAALAFGNVLRDI